MGNVMRVMVHRGVAEVAGIWPPLVDVFFPPAGIRPCAPLAEGAGAGGAAPVLSGVRPDGLAGCAQAGAESASAAITATPLKRFLVFICSLR